MKPKLRTHSIQKNYIAIWYSILIHFLLLILVVNYIEMDVMGILNDFNLNFITGLFSTESVPDKSMINELFKNSNQIDFEEVNFTLLTFDC